MTEQTMQYDPTRRNFLRICCVSGVPIGLAACAPAVTGEAGAWALTKRSSGSFFDAGQMSVLSDMAELIIGDGPWPSASDADCVTFLDDMLGEWAGPILKARLSRLPAQLNRFSIRQQLRSYVYLDQPVRAQLLADYDELAFSDRSSEASVSYREFKSLVLKIYNTSTEMNADYVRVPGTYFGDLSETQQLGLVRDKSEGLAT